MDEDDPVVRELDVYICNEFLGSHTQIYLFQHPLRPPWRPYDYDKVKKMRMKPNARRIEVDLPIDTESKNYNDIVEDYKKVDKITLRSSLVDMKTSFAIGTVKDDKLLLAPVDNILQLKPVLNFLNVERKKQDENSDDEEEDEPKMLAVEVQVQKRETERQQQARLSSYAYLTHKEEEEPWKEINLHGESSTAAREVWSRFMKAVDNVPAPPMDRSSYLKAVLPVGGSAPILDGTLEQDAPSTANTAETISEEVLKALPAALTALFQKHPVCSMANIRQWLQDYPAGDPAREAAFLTDRSLHETIMQTKDFVCIRRSYIKLKTSAPAQDPVRLLAIELLKDKESFKRSEIFEMAGLRKIQLSDTLYNKVVKDLCISRGNQWFLKSGADMP